MDSTLAALVEALRAKRFFIPAEVRDLGGLLIAIKCDRRYRRGSARSLSVTLNPDGSWRSDDPPAALTRPASGTPAAGGADWQPHVATRGANKGRQVGWENPATGEVRYQREKPGAADGADGAAGGAAPKLATTSTPPAAAASKGNSGAGAPAKTPAPAPASPPKSSTEPHPFPSGEELATAPGEHLKAGGAVRTAEVGGKKYVVKQTSNTADSGKIEALSSDLARVAGVNMPPAQMTTINGRPALVQGFADGRTIESLKKESPAAARAALAKVPKEQVDRNVMFDYLMGHTDVHDGNYLVSDDGRLTAIDKEMVLGRGNLTGQKFEPPHLLALAHPDGHGMLYRFDLKTVGAMADAGGKMATELERRGMKKEARQVSDRAVVLRKLAARPNVTAGDLHKLGVEGVTPPNLGLLGKLKWHFSRG